MKFTVKALLNKGYSQRDISKELVINRKTVKEYFDEISSTEIQIPKIERYKKLNVYYVVKERLISII